MICTFSVSGQLTEEMGVSRLGSSSKVAIWQLGDLCWCLLTRKMQLQFLQPCFLLATHHQYTSSVLLKSKIKKRAGTKQSSIGRKREDPVRHVPCFMSCSRQNHSMLNQRTECWLTNVSSFQLEEKNGNSLFVLISSFLQSLEKISSLSVVLWAFQLVEVSQAEWAAYGPKGNESISVCL